MKTVIEIWITTNTPKGLKTRNDLRVQLRKQSTIFSI